MDNGFERLIALARHHTQTFGRTITAEIYRPEDGLLVITKLHDDVHDVQLAILVDKRTMVLDELAIRMERIPYHTCLQSTESFKKLEGLHLFERGVTKVMRKTVGKALGCTHVMEMLDVSLRTLFAEVGIEVAEPVMQGLDLQERQQLAVSNPLLVDTCFSFNHDLQDGELTDRARAKVKENIDKGAPLEALTSFFNMRGEKRGSTKSGPE